jgi:sirohydrochlorin ferrochelatase
MHADGRTTGLVIVAHGERTGAAANHGLLRHAARLAEQWPGMFVRAAVLHGEPSLQRAWMAAAEHDLHRLLVYPLFMSDGYTVRQLLAGRVEGNPRLDVTLMSPLGLDARLPSLLLDESLRASGAAGWAPRHTRLLVAAHGSRLARGSVAAIVRIASALRERNVFAEVEPAYLDHPPLLDQALRGAARPAIVAGCFAGEGVHACRDVPAAIGDAAATAVYTGPIGVHPKVGTLIVDAVSGELARSRCGEAGRSSQAWSPEAAAGEPYRWVPRG